MKDIIKKAIERWDKKHISSLIEEDVDSLTDYIYRALSKKSKRNFIITGEKWNHI